MFFFTPTVGLWMNFFFYNLLKYIFDTLIHVSTKRNPCHTNAIKSFNYHSNESDFPCSFVIYLNHIIAIHNELFLWYSLVPTAQIIGGPDLHVDKGSTINLTCAVKYSPEPPAYIFWYHHDEVISYDSSRGGVSVSTIKAKIL